MHVAGGGCGPVVVIAFLPCPSPWGELFLLLSPSQRVDLALQFLGNKPSPPLKLGGGGGGGGGVQF